MAESGILIDLQVRVNEIMALEYDVQQVDKIPTKDDVTFKEKAVSVDAACLFIDIRNSTGLLNKYGLAFMANILKSYHFIITKIVKFHQGEIRSFNGDGILALFEGQSGCDNAVSTALNSKYALKLLVKPLFTNKGNFDFGIGIDYGKIMVIKAGIYGEFNNDLIWMSKSVNNASKMGNLAKNPNNIIISKNVYSRLSNINKVKRIINSSDLFSLIMAGNNAIWDNDIPIGMFPGNLEQYFTNHERPL